MKSNTFRALMIRKEPTGAIRAEIENTSLDDLPPGEVTLRVDFSSLNYKDALAIEGHPGVVRHFPHVPGIDAAGVVAESSSPNFAPGDEVIVTGYGLGERFWGGHAELIRVPVGAAVPRPVGMTLEQAMLYGTAGFTAGMCVEAIQRQEIVPEHGDVVVTGASGGVGTIAVGILAKLGYRVTAVTGKTAAHPLLRELGAAEIVDREQVQDTSDRPMLKTRWAAAVDTVGGTTLATLIRAMQPRGCVAACGLVGGEQLDLTVYPFILRGVTLAGIDSVECPMPLRTEIWKRLAEEWRPAALAQLEQRITLEQVVERARLLKSGEASGRTVVEMGAE